MLAFVALLCLLAFSRDSIICLLICCTTFCKSELILYKIPKYMKPNSYPYNITFPIWKCPQWSALRGRLKLTDEQVVVARFNDCTFLDEEIAFLDAQFRIKPQIEGRPIRPAQELLPSVLQIIRTNQYTDIVLDNCSQWQLTTGDLSKLLLIYFAYDVYVASDLPPRDCTLENILRNGDSIVALDFGLRKRTEKYCIYWNPLILKGKPYQHSYQWSLGIIYIAMTQGQQVLNEIHRHVSEWLKGGRLDIPALLNTRKPAVLNLLTGLLNPESPIPWESIPHHSAFRDDPQSRQVLKLFDVRSVSELRVRSSTRLSSRNSVSPLTILPNPGGRRTSFMTDQIPSQNQSLVTKISSLYQLHKDKVRQSVMKQNSGKVLNSQIANIKLSKQFNNFFSTIRLQPKGCKTQGPKSFRNVASNTSNTQREYKEKEPTNDLSQYKVPSRRVSQDHRDSVTEIDKVRGRLNSMKLIPTTASEQYQRTISQYDSREKQPLERPGEVEDIAKRDRRLSQYDSWNLNAEASSQVATEVIPDNYIQLIKKPNEQIQIFLREYTRGLDLINVIGQTVAKCIEFLNGLQNFWVIPLFLAFKRMLQLRYQVENYLESHTNNFQIACWAEVCDSKDFMLFLNKVKSDNNLVFNEMLLLLKAARNKAEKLDHSRKEKVEWFLNEQMDENINDVCLTYLKGQIYKSVKERKGIQKPYLEWLRLTIQVQATIIIMQLPPLAGEIGSFSYEAYLEAMNLEDIQAIGKYIQQNEQYLEQ